MQNETTQLRKEFENYLKYWLQYMFNADDRGVFPEISMANIPNKTADLGSMYLSRIIYGASRGAGALNDHQYKPLAEVCFETLMEFKNPLGGYFWGRKHNMEWIHDVDNVNMAQAFVLYGLVEYASLSDSSEIDQLIDQQLDFMASTLKDHSEPYYLDGFNENWVKGKNMTRSFGTHFHIMEALVKVYNYKKSKEIKLSIRSLLYVILDRFIDKENYSCLHRFSENWQLLPNENWAGHNAECSWVICNAAKTINDAELINRTEEIAVLMMDEVIKLARDHTNGGYANLISNTGEKEKEKSWWPQAEVVLGLLNVYKITGDKNYQTLAKEQILYIQEYFVSEAGEWCAAVNQKGVPLKSNPQIFFWKSMYHTVRYYDYLLHIS